ncbi:hypothetical protein [Actinomyces culturomici]|nr:hypothetical protein [Actinomyces culturomici]
MSSRYGVLHHPQKRQESLKTAVEAAELVEETAQVATLSCLLRTRGGGSL